MLCYASYKYSLPQFVENMLILGIDTSCDDTSAAVVEDGIRIISNITSSQDEVHKRYGGIVPELASRRHIEMLWPVAQEAMRKAQVHFSDISAIAVSHGPGLIGSLLVGVCFAKSVSLVHNIPLLAVNHLEGHIFSSFLSRAPGFPFIALVVSGGHTSLYAVKSFGSYRELARTRDDAAGEAFDKVAKVLGYGFPGGPIIDDLAAKGNSSAISFPRAHFRGSLDFSFSGLKTAVITYVRNHPDARIEDIASSFQSAVIDVLVQGVLKASSQEGINRIVLSGGVSANSALRTTMSRAANEAGLSLFLPPPSLCTDNAAMIAAAGYHHFRSGNLADSTLNPKAYLPLGNEN